MEYQMSEEHDELRRSVRRFCQEASPMSEVRRLMATKDGFDQAVWHQMAAELGLQSLAIPERFGGAGYTWCELAVVFEELGRCLCTAPLFSTVALGVAAVLASGDDEAAAELLPGIARGEVVATLALSEPSGRAELEAVQLQAERAAGSGSRHDLLSGTKMFVTDGCRADLLLVVGRAPEGISLYAVAGDAPGLRRTPLLTMDQTRKQARLDFDATPGRLVGRRGDAAAFLPGALDLASIALAAEQVGGAQRCLEMSVAYAKQRVQFGRTIGSFQAIKHRCAEMLLDLESARSAASYAAFVAAGPPHEELGQLACMAKATCSDAYARISGENIQIHGGIGFTFEHDAHLYFKRAKSSEVLLGDPAYHRELLAQRVGI
jgi:alkylation response protein AidB-like acyl-CoA dehydrogenase